MITFAFERKRRIVLMRFALALNRETLARLDAMTRQFAALEGPADSIIDFSGVPTRDIIDLAIAHERTQRPLVMPGRARVFVAPHDQLYGSLRVYAARQVNTPLVVRTLDAALSHFNVVEADFRLIDIDPAPDTV